MYILYAAPLSWFVMLFPQANTAPGMMCIQISYIFNATGMCLGCINFQLVN